MKRSSGVTSLGEWTEPTGSAVVELEKKDVDADAALSGTKASGETGVP